MVNRRVGELYFVVLAPRKPLERTNTRERESIINLFELVSLVLQLSVSAQ